KFGILDTGGQVLSSSASHYFGTFGFVLLAVVIILACLTTAIGLMTACGEYFHSLFPKIGYKTFVVIFTTFCFVVSNFGLSNIITYSESPKLDRKSTRLNSSHVSISYAVFCLKKKNLSQN